MVYSIEQVLDALDVFQEHLDGQFGLSDFNREEIVDALEDILNAMPCDFCNSPSTDELIDNAYYCEDCLSKTQECYVCESVVMPEECIFDTEALVTICITCKDEIDADQHTY